MKKLDTHGMKMTGIKAAAGATKDLTPYGGSCVQVSYDRETGEVLTAYHVGSGWTLYHESSIVTACYATAPMTMQEVADSIADKVRCIWADEPADCEV